jgi:hypothetical protein
MWSGEIELRQAGIEGFDDNKGGIVFVWIHIGGIYY